ncbi:MAG: high-affinity branched-chain amino acid ABC transporter permease LivM [Rhodospirillales bacterium]|nr:MAG: high-affinity branched-chain amino acid ABC transporter permease LivM [Rhodospirillales bacterium]
MAETAAKGLDPVAILKEAGLAAFVALMLAVPLAGLETVSAPGGLTINTRWDWVAIAVGSVFVGRLLLILWREQGRRRSGPRLDLDIGENLRTAMPVLAAAGIAFAVVLPFLPFADRRVLDIGILVMTYIMLGWGLNIVVGLAGLLDLGYVAFYAVGAYSYALLAIHFDLSFWVCLPLAGALAALFGYLLGFPVLRLRGDYLAIVTLGFGEIIRIILINWYDLTRGPDGISGIPRPTFFGLDFARSPPPDGHTFHTFFGLDFSPLHRIIFLYYLILVLALITNAFTLRIRRLPVGRAWEALREDEIACRSLGINPRNTKLTAFTLGAMFAGFAGSFFATRQGFISPESFTFIESAIIVAIVVLGGMGSQIGVVVATLVLIAGPELIRELQEFRMLAFGGLMVMIMIWRPRGLLAFRDPTVRLHPAPRRRLGFGRRKPAGSGAP